jgi:2-dehydro-3-deoxyphosphogluconate aldolase/(4S)-4-hydroxy-2-oxoglutarate aldolase
VDTALVKRFEQLRLIPIVTMEDARHAKPVAEALVAGGLPCAEVTFRTDAAVDVLRAMAQRGGMLVGAGTVLNVDAVKAATEAGAQFIVTPGLHHAVVEHCVERGIPIAPGVATASEIAWAHDRGLRVVKFFPAAILGGPPALEALGAAYPMMKFIPTGGIDEGNVRDYLRLPQVLACGGTWLARTALYESGDYGDVTRVVRQAVALVDDDPSAGQQPPAS